MGFKTPFKGCRGSYIHTYAAYNFLNDTIMKGAFNRLSSIRAPSFSSPASSVSPKNWKTGGQNQRNTSPTTLRSKLRIYMSTTLKLPWWYIPSIPLDLINASSKYAQSLIFVPYICNSIYSSYSTILVFRCWHVYQGKEYFTFLLTWWVHFCKVRYVGLCIPLQIPVNLKTSNTLIQYSSSKVLL